MTATAHTGSDHRLTGWTPAMILAAAAELEENAIKDQTYRETPIGRLAGEYLDRLAFLNYSKDTLRSREPVLARLAIMYAHLEPDEITLGQLEAFLYKSKDLAGTTKENYTSTVRVFFKWAHDNDHIPADPARRLRGPRLKDTTRHAHSAAEFRRLVAAQRTQRERVGLLLLYWCALRRNELRLVQFEHIDLYERTLVIVGAKGGSIQTQNIPEQLALPLERYVQDRMPEAREFVLHPRRVGRYGRYPVYAEDVIWEDKTRPLSMPGVDKWWQRCCEAAGVPQFPMHELRHTAGTEFHKASGDLYATQQFMRHKSPATTARIYLHLDVQKTVAEVQRKMADPMEDA